MYRARDPRIGRDVAIKILPASLSQDQESLHRFEQEAKATGALSHPNILAIYDVGTENGTPYLVSELLSGETLRRLLTEGALSVRKSIDYALQIAHGLAAAHEKGIIHRDLKPENLFVTKEERLKILDFGLAKLIHSEVSESQLTEAATRSRQTEPGAIMGTVVYMSPEQVSGQKVDHRSDIFAFGAILYEMISGKRPFQGDTHIEVMHSILKADPPDLLLTQSGSNVPALERIIRRCLEKNPDRRFQSTSDLAFALEALSSPSGTGTTTVLQQPARPLWHYLAFVLPILAIIASFLTGKFVGIKQTSTLQAKQGSSPTAFYQLTFRNGFVGRARFTPDGQNIVYSAAWNGKPLDIYFSRIGSPETRDLGMQDVDFFSISPQGDLALDLETSSLDHSLAQVPFVGGKPRQLSTGITDAEWSPDSKNLAVVRYQKRIEFPMGKMLYKSEHDVVALRFSPDGKRLAFVEMRPPGIGSVYVMNLDGTHVKLGEALMMGHSGLAWSSNGSEVWFAENPRTGNGTRIGAFDLKGNERDVLLIDGNAELFDISKDGRVLLARGFHRNGLFWSTLGESKERDLSWLDGSVIADISDDGRKILLLENREGSGGKNRSMYLRSVDESEAVRLGDGWAIALSPDQQSVLAMIIPSLIQVPVGSGQTRVLLNDLEDGYAKWFPDGKRILLDRYPKGLSVYDVGNAKEEPLMPAKMYSPSSPHSISPDGKYVVAASPENSDEWCLYSFEKRELQKIPGIEPGEDPIRWSADGSSLYVYNGALPARVYRIDVKTGRRELWKELMPSDASGVIQIRVAMTPRRKNLCLFFFACYQPGLSGRRSPLNLRRQQSIIKSRL